MDHEGYASRFDIWNESGNCSWSNTCVSKVWRQAAQWGDSLQSAFKLWPPTIYQNYYLWGFFCHFWNYCVKITFLFQLIISCCSQLETVGTMGETLRVKAGEDAIKRVQQGFDKVAKEKQMNGSVILLIISVDRPSCWMWVGLFGWRVTQSWPGRRTVSQHRLHTVLRDALLRNMLGFGIRLVLHPAHRWYKNLI